MNAIVTDPPVRLALPRQRAYYERLGYRAIHVLTHAGYTEPTYLMLEKQLADS
jgi:hypothetical protein